MTWTTHVRVDSTMSSVGSSSHLRRSVYVDVLDHQTIGVQALVVGVALGVSQQLQQELGGLHWPSTLTVVERFRLTLSAHTTVVASERHDLLLRDHVLQVALSTSQRHMTNRRGSFASVLLVRVFDCCSRFIWLPIC